MFDALHRLLTGVDRSVPPPSRRTQRFIFRTRRASELLVRQRTSAVNAMRGLLSEFGVVAAKGIRRVEELRQRMIRTEPALLPDEAREAIGVLFDHLDGLQDRVEKVEARILAWHKASEASQRLASAPGVGPPDGDSNRRRSMVKQKLPKHRSHSSGQEARRNKSINANRIAGNSA